MLQWHDLTWGFLFLKGARGGQWGGILWLEMYIPSGKLRDKSKWGPPGRGDFVDLETLIFRFHVSILGRKKIYISECWQRHVLEDAFIEHSQRLEGHFGWRIFCEANTVIEGKPKLPSLKLTWPLKIGGWKLLSVWDGLFPGPMLVSGNLQLYIYTERFGTMDWLESQGSGNQLNKKQTELYKPMFRQAGSDWNGQIPPRLTRQECQWYGSLHLNHWVLAFLFSEAFLESVQKLCSFQNAW